MNRLALALASFWLGLQVMAGYVAAPVLFQTLEKLQAGMIAGKLFAAVSYSGFAVWLLVWILSKRSGAGKWACWILILLAANQFLVTPVIEAHKMHTENWLLHLAGGSFGMWHGISSLLFMLCALSALVCIWRGVRQPQV